MRKHYLFTLGAMIACSALSTQARSPYLNYDPSDKTWDMHWDGSQLVQATTAKASDWMADLPDNMFVAHVSIPGTHNTMTGGDDPWVSASGPGCSTTQVADLDEQLRRGIRALDLRPGLYNAGDSDNPNWQLRCNHGADVTKTLVSTAMTKMVNYLNAHPKEFLVLHLFRGNVYSQRPDNVAQALICYYDDASKKRLNSMMNDVFNKGNVNAKVIEYRPNLTVGECRGKIIILRRDRIDFVNLPKAGYMTNWTTEFNAQNPGKVYNASDRILATDLHMQDLSEGGDDVLYDQKIPQARALMQWAQTQPEPNAQYNLTKSYVAPWVMNFTSIENSGTSSRVDDNTNGYKGGSSVMNPNVCQYLDAHMGEGPLGIFLSDNVLRGVTKNHQYTTMDEKHYEVYGADLVYKIIQNNFAGSNPPVKRFALDTTIDWNQKFTNPYEGQIVYFRHIKTGKWLCGGNGYGSRMSLDDFGYPFTISLDKTSGYSQVSIHNMSTCLGWGINGETDKLFVDRTNKLNFKLNSGTQPGSVVFNFFQDTNGNNLGTSMAATVESLTNSPYWDNLSYTVEARPYEFGNIDQEFEIVTRAQRLKEITYTGVANDINGANQSRPMDATFLVPCYSFGNGWNGVDQNKWTFSPTTYYGSYPESSGQLEGSHIKQINYTDGGAYLTVWNHQQNDLVVNSGKRSFWTLSKTISSLPNGKYKVTFQALANNNEYVKYNIGGKTGTVHRFAQTEETADGGSETYLKGIGQRFKNGEGLVELNDVTISGGSLSLTFSMQESKRKPTSFYLDNVHLTYLGPANNPKTTVNLTFPEHWNTMILPFAVSESDLNAALGTDRGNIHIYRATGLETTGKVLQENQNQLYEYHLVQRSQSVNTLAANTPYIVENTNYDEVIPQVTSKKAPARRAADTSAKVYTFTGYPVHTRSTYVDDSNTLTGVLADNHTVGEGHYTLKTTNFQLFDRLSGNSTAGVDKFRAYVHAGATDAIHPMILFNDIENVLTGVEDVAAEEAAADLPVDVYNASGMLLRSNAPKAEALEGLARGVYILHSQAATEKVLVR